MNAQWYDFIRQLKIQVVPALGCTEPVSVALAAANCRRLLNTAPESMRVLVSGNLFKNGMGVGVPGTQMIGLPIAAAVGAIGGNPDGGLEVLQSLTPELVAEAKKLLPKISVAIKENSDPLYVEILAEAQGHNARVIIEGNHTRVVTLERDGVVLMQQPTTAVAVANPLPSNHTAVKLESIVDFALNVPLDEILFILEAANLNHALAQEGLKGYGIQIGKTLSDQIERKLLSDDLMNRAMRLAAAASDARMDGAMLPAMANSGSGNQGIAATMPIVAAAQILECSEEQLARALVMSHLIAIYIKSFQDKLSALCAASTAAMGSGAAITWLLGGDLTAIGSCINLMIADISGMLCDGAGSGCSLKVSTSTSCAIKAALLATNQHCVPTSEGIICADVDATIANLGKLTKGGMTSVDKQVITLMQDKVRAAEALC